MAWCVDVELFSLLFVAYRIYRVDWLDNERCRIFGSCRLSVYRCRLFGCWLNREMDGRGRRSAGKGKGKGRKERSWTLEPKRDRRETRSWK